MKSLITFFTSKLTLGKYIVLLLSTLLTLLISMKAAFFGLLFLILLDLITGIRKSFYKKGNSLNPLRKEFWTTIKSYLLRQTLKKFYEYCMLIIVVAVVESMIIGTTMIGIAGGQFTLSEISIGFIASVEVYSIFENMEGVSGRNILKRFIKVFKSIK